MELTIREAATVLGISERAVRSRIRRGTLPARKRGGRWMLSRAALPLDATQRKRLHAKADALRDAIEDALPAAVRQRPAHRLDDLDVFRLAHDLHSEAPVLSTRGHLDALGYRLTREGWTALPRARRVQDAMAGRASVDIRRSLAATVGVEIF